MDGPVWTVLCADFEKADNTILNTGRMEPYYTKGERCARYAWSYLVVLLCVLTAIVLATGIVIFRVEFLRILWSIDNVLLHKFARIIVSCVGGLAYFQPLLSGRVRVQTSCVKPRF